MQLLQICLLSGRQFEISFETHGGEDQVYYLLRHLKEKKNFSLSLFQIFVHLRSKSSCILFANFDLNFCNLAGKASVHFWITDPDCLDGIASLRMLRCHQGIEMVSSLIWRSQGMTSRCKKKISPSRLYHMSKNCWQIFFRSSIETKSKTSVVLLQFCEREQMSQKRGNNCPRANVHNKGEQMSQNRGIGYPKIGEEAIPK